MGYTIYDLAELAVTDVGLRGIDWAALDQQGHGGIWSREYMKQYLVPAQVKMIVMAGGLSGVQLEGGESQIFRDASRENVSTLQQIGMSLPIISGPVTVAETTVKMSQEAIRWTVSHAYQSAIYACQLHFDETIHHSGLSDADIASHANLACGTMNALTMLDSIGFYTAMGIKTGAPQPQTAPAQSGLGIAPVAIVAITVVAIAALALLAWIIISLASMNKMSSIVATMCDRAQASGDAATTQQCIQTATAATKQAATTLPDLVKSTIDAVLPYAAAAAAVYAAFLFGPEILSLIASGRRRAATT
jgi:hypothetical protein